MKIKIISDLKQTRELVDIESISFFCGFNDFVSLAAARLHRLQQLSKGVPEDECALGIKIRGNVTGKDVNALSDFLSLGKNIVTTTFYSNAGVSVWTLDPTVIFGHTTIRCKFKSDTLKYSILMRVKDDNVYH